MSGFSYYIECSSCKLRGVNYPWFHDLFSDVYEFPIIDAETASLSRVKFRMPGSRPHRSEALLLEAERHVTVTQRVIVPRFGARGEGGIAFRSVVVCPRDSGSLVAYWGSPPVERPKVDLSELVGRLLQTRHKLETQELCLTPENIEVDVSISLGVPTVIRWWLAGGDQAAREQVVVKLHELPLFVGSDWEESRHRGEVTRIVQRVPHRFGEE